MRRSPLKTVNNYTLDQLFFIGFGTVSSFYKTSFIFLVIPFFPFKMWCSTETEVYLNKIIKSKYAPARFRVNGVVSNMEEFATAFNCPIGSKMNPTEKCSLW